MKALGDIDFVARLRAVRRAAPAVTPDEPLPPLVERQRRAGIPERFLDARLPDLDAALAARLAAWHANPAGRSLAFWGPVGSGKTWAATALLTDAIEHGARGRWTGARDLLESLRAERAQGGYGALDGYMWPPLLVLDDLGREWLAGDGAGWSRDRLYDVIGHRYNRELPLLVTTNLTPAQLGELDPPLASRLLSGVVVKVDGRDRRFAPRGRA